MANLKRISAALKLVDTKKDNLRKAFEDLQSQSSFSLSSFSLSWPDLDSHFTSLQSTLEHRFNNLQSQKPQSPSPPEQQQQQPPSSSSLITVKKSSEESANVMKSLCEEMNGLGLRRYVVERSKEWSAIRAELLNALRSSPDAPAMVLDAMEGFYVPDSKGDNDKELCAIRNACLFLLGELRAMEPEIEIKPEVRERANNLAVEWKGKACLDRGNPFEILGFLHLLVSYGLVDGFDFDELIEFVVVAASTRYTQTIKLCHNLSFGISDVIQKLISKGKQLLAVKFIFEFGLAGKFPPVPLLKDYVKDSKKSAQNVRKDPKSNNKSLIGATMKEISALQLVIKYIEDHKLESEYPKENLVKRIEQLRKESRSQKRKPQEDSGSKRPPTNSPAGPAPTPSRQLRSQKRKPQDSGSKRPRTTAPAGPSATPSSVAAQRTIAPPLQQPHLLPGGLLPEHPALYSRLPAGPYGLAAPTPATGRTPTVPPYGSTPAVPPYQGSSAGLYGFAGSPMGPTGSHQYPSQSHVPSSAYSVRPVAYSGYGLPQQFHPSYFPQ